MYMDIKKIIQYWLEGAGKDWIACQHLYENKDYPQCLFWGHLVLEKILKALVVKATNSQSPYTHDLLLLASKAGLALNQEQKDSLNEITTFNQFGRYDSEIISFAEKCTPDFAKKYFDVIKNLYTWLMEYFHKMN